MATPSFRPYAFGGFSPYEQDPNDEDIAALLDGGPQPVAAPPMQQQPQPTPERAAPVIEDTTPDPVIQRAAQGQHFGGFSLRDDGDQDLEATLLHDGDMQHQLSMKPTTSHTLPNLPIREGDPELERAQRNAQLHALEQSMYDPHDYGIAELARDVLPGVVAGGFDAVFNHGRGAGGILQATAAENARGEAARQQAAHQAGQLAVSMRGKEKDPFDQWYKQQLIEKANADRAVRVEGQGGVQGRFDATRDDRNDPSSQRNTTAVSQAELTAAARQRGAINQKHELVDVQAGDAAQIAGGRTSATTNAETDALRSNPRALTADQEIDNSRDQQSIDLKKQNADLVADRDKRGDADKYQKDIGNMVEVAKAARALQNMYKNTQDAPGLGVWDSMKPGFLRSQSDTDAATQLAQLRSFVQGPITGAAVGGKAEEKRINELAGDAQGMTEQGARAAIDNLAGLANSRLRSYSVGREDVARQVLAQHGLDDLIGPASPAAAASPSGGNAPGSLGVTPMPANPLGGGRRRRTITDPKTGETDSEMMTDQQVQKLLADNPGLRVQ